MKIRFLIRNAFLMLRGNYIVRFVLFVTIAVGIFVPVYLFGMAEKMLRNAEISESAYHEYTVIAEFLDECRTEKEMDDLLTALMPETRGFGYQVLAMETITWNDQDIVCMVSGVSRDFWNYEGYELLEGEIFAAHDLHEEQVPQGDARTCVLNSSARVVEQGIRTGDCIYILDTPYIVIGIVNAPKAYGSVFLEYEQFLVSEEENIDQYKIIFDMGQEVDLQDRKILFDRRFDEILSLVSAKENHTTYLESVFQILKKRSMIGLGVMIFAMIGLIMVLIAKSVTEQYQYAVKLSSGATAGQIVMEIVLQNSLFTIAAIIVDLIICKIIAQNSTLLFYETPKGFKAVFLFIAIIFVVAVITGICIRTILRKNSIAALLNEGDETIC